MKRPVSADDRKQGRGKPGPKPLPLHLPVPLMQAVLEVANHAQPIPTPKTLSAVALNLRRKPPALTLSGLPVPADPICPGSASSQPVASDDLPPGLGAFPKGGSLGGSVGYARLRQVSGPLAVLDVQMLLTLQWPVIFFCQFLPSWAMRANCVALSRCPFIRTCTYTAFCNLVQLQQLSDIFQPFSALQALVNL